MPEYLGLSSAIVSTLKEYKTALPVDFLARVYGRRVEDIDDRLRSLEEANVVKISDDGETVSLISLTQGKSDPQRTLARR